MDFTTFYVHHITESLYSQLYLAQFPMFNIPAITMLFPQNKTEPFLPDRAVYNRKVARWRRRAIQGR